MECGSHGSWIAVQKRKKEMHNQISSSGQGLEHGSHGLWIAVQKVNQNKDEKLYRSLLTWNVDCMDNWFVLRLLILLLWLLVGSLYIDQGSLIGCVF